MFYFVYTKKFIIYVIKQRLICSRLSNTFVINSLISVLTILGILIGSLLGGVVIIEQVFGWSGVGWLSIQAISVRDYPMVQGIVLFAAASFILANLVVDILYGLVDPRVRELW